MTARAKRKQSRKTRSPKQSPKAGPDLYLGCFYFDDYGDENHEGTFQMLVEATSPEHSVARFRSQLRKLKSASTLFGSPTTVFCSGIVKLVEPFKDSVLLNYQCGPSRTPDWVLENLMPEQEGQRSELYGYGGKDESEVIPFIDFGGKAAAARAKAPDEELLPTPGPVVSREALAAQRARAQELVRAEKAKRAAERAAERERRAKARTRKEQRDQAVRNTLDELGLSRPARKTDR